MLKELQSVTIRIRKGENSFPSVLVGCRRFKNTQQKERTLLLFHFGEEIAFGKVATVGGYRASDLVQLLSDVSAFLGGGFHC